MREGALAGRYRLIEPLGSGGMSEVWAAEDQSLERQVAVKLMLPSTTATPGAAERFGREARAAARLTHPNVVGVYDVGEHDGRLFLVMEKVRGHSLAAMLREGVSIDPAQVVELGVQAADALAVAHAEGIVHRDVKPANLLLSQDGTLKITDFGVARFTEPETTGLTGTGNIVGTSGYLSPEQVSGEPVTPSSDLYALGCVLYELLVGHPPFAGENTARVLYQHVHEEPVPPSRLRADVPAELERLVLGLLAKDPAARGADAAGVAAVLRSLAGHADPGGPAGRDAPTSPLAGPPSPRTAVFTGGALATSRRSHRERLRDPRLLLAAGGLVAVIVVALLLATSGTGGGSGHSPVGTTSSPAQTGEQPPPAEDGKGPPGNRQGHGPPGERGNGPPDKQQGRPPPKSGAALLSAIDRRLGFLARSGRVDAKLHEKVHKHVDDAREKLAEGKPDEAGRKLRDAHKELRKAAEKDEWQPDTRLLRLLARFGEGAPDQGGEGGGDEGSGEGDADEDGD